MGERDDFGGIVTSESDLQGQQPVGGGAGRAIGPGTAQTERGGVEVAEAKLGGGVVALIIGGERVEPLK